MVERLLAETGKTEHRISRLNDDKESRSCTPSPSILWLPIGKAIIINSVTEGWRQMELLDRITQEPGVMGGKACIRGLRVTVGMVVGQIGAGHSVEEILADYPYLEREDVMQALRYAAWRAEEREIVLATA